jgi:hypothetical protein
MTNGLVTLFIQTEGGETAMMAADVSITKEGFE